MTDQSPTDGGRTGARPDTRHEAIALMRARHDFPDTVTDAKIAGMMGTQLLALTLAMEALRDVIVASVPAWARRLSSRRFLACVAGCFAVLAVLSLATWSLTPLAFGVVAWFVGSLWRRA